MKSIKYVLRIEIAELNMIASSSRDRAGFGLFPTPKLAIIIDDLLCHGWEMNWDFLLQHLNLALALKPIKSWTLVYLLKVW